MISSLNGLLIDISGNSITVEVGGVGYLVNCSPSVIDGSMVGDSIRLIVHTDVREDAITLYGFKDKLERQTFLLLKTVKGIGSRTAIEVLSQISPQDLLRIIGSGDTAKLQSLKGIGKKTAERIVVELKESVGQFATDQVLVKQLRLERDTFDTDAMAALMALGFSEAIAKGAIGKVLSGDSRPSDTGDFVRQALAFV